MADTATDRPAEAAERTAVFVSYSRHDQDFVLRLAPTLEQRGLDVWVDLDDIGPSTDWSDEIRHGIEGAEAVIVVVSPDSCASTEVAKEIDRAESLGKRIVPVLHRAIEPSDAHPAVARRNWISWLSDADAQTALAKIDESLTADPAWAKEHTRLQNLALEWERNDHRRSELLSGPSLDAAEAAILVDRPPEQPHATELMRQFVAESRAAHGRRQRRIVITSLAVAGVSITLAIVALVFRQEAATQRDEAVRQRDTATAAALAAQSENRFGSEPDLAALLALEAFRTRDTVDARGSLLDVVDRPTTFVQRWEVHDTSVIAMVEHPVLPLAATADEAGRVVFWERLDEISAFVPRGDSFEAESAVVAMAFEPAGAELVVSAFEDGEGRLLRLDASADAVVLADGDTRPILGFSGNLARGASISESSSGGVTLGVHNMAAPEQPLDVDLAVDAVALEESDSFVPPLAVAPDGSRIAVAFGTEIHVWTESLAVLDPVVYDTEELGIFDAERLFLEVFSLAFIDEDRLAFGTEEGNIHILGVGLTPEHAADLDLDAGEPADDLTEGEAFFAALAAQGDAPPVGEAFFPPSASRVWALDVAEVEVVEGVTETVLASAHNNGEVRTWFVEDLDGFDAASLRGHDEEVRAVLLSDAGLVLSGSFDGDVITSNLQPTAAIGVGYEDPVLGTSHAIDVADVAYAGPDLVVSLDELGELRLWDPATGEVVGQVDGVASIDAVDDVVLFGGDSGEIGQLEMSSGAEVFFESTHDDAVTALAVSPDGQTVASADATAMWIWDSAGQRTAIAALPSDLEVETLEFADAERLWVGGSNDDDIAVAALVDATTGAVLTDIRHNPLETGHHVASIAVSDDGRTLVTGGSDRRIYVWDATDLDADPAELDGHLDTVTSVVFLDATTIVASDNDGRTLLWDLVVGRVVGDLTGPADAVNALALHPTGEAIVAASQDDIVWSWDLRDERWVEQACALAGRNLSATEWEQFQLDGDPVRHCPEFPGGEDWPEAEYPSRGGAAS